MASSANESAGSAHASPEAARIQKAIDTVQPKIKQILLKYNGEPAGNTLSYISPAQEIKHMCIDADLAYTRPIFGRNCGIHPQNRAGTGVDPFNAQKLALKISLQGYSETKLENPMSFEPAGMETAESAMRRDLQLEFNERTFAEASGYLRTIPHYDLLYLPVTCSHTFAALNIIEGGCKGLHKELTGDDGMIDRQKVLKLCPSWKKPMTAGIPCIVFRREIEEACPELPEFLIKAGNQSHDVHSKETKVQLMLSMNQLFVGKKRMAESTAPAGSAPAASAGSAPTASAGSAPAAPASWATVVKEISIMKPHFQDC